MKVYSVFFAALFMFLSCGSSAFAQDNAGITLIPATIEERADPGTTQSHTLKITNVSGADKEMVGTVSAKMRDLRPVEPYQGKGIRYAGEFVRRKAGKAAGATGGK